MAAAQNPIHIGGVVANAATFNFRRHAARENMTNSEPLLETVEKLFQMLDERRVEYLLVGGIALLQYIEGRNTEDIDLIVSLADLHKLPEINVTHRDDDFARGEWNGLRIDFLLARNKLFRTVRESYATKRPFLEREIPCANVAGLLLLKLYALPALYRMGNFARVGLYENDIATLLHEYRPSLEPLWAELAKHLSEADLNAVSEIVSDIEERIRRFDASAG